MAYILQLLNPIIHKGDRLMKRLFSICILLGYAFVLGQTESAQDSQLLQSNFQVLGSLIWKLKFYSIDFLRS